MQSSPSNADRRTGTDIQREIFEHGSTGTPGFPISFESWEKAAREKLAAGPFEYVFGAAGNGDTLRNNLEAFRRCKLVARKCVDIGERDLSIELFGQRHPFPFLLAPVGVNTIVHPGGEIAAAKAAASCGVPYILSCVSSKPMEEVAEAAGKSTKWFQIYPPRKRELTVSLLERAEKAGYSAIVVTVDSILMGWRERDLTNGYLPFLQGEGFGNYFSDPVFLSWLERPPEEDIMAASRRALEESDNVSFTWEELAFFRERTKLPLLIKGILHPEDAEMAVRAGVDGVIVSNHGGRQLDGAVSSLEMLPAVCRSVGSRVPVLLDSGIRRGSDVVKALALGARAVLIGRPYVYGLAVGGQDGVKAVIEHFIADTELSLANCGKTAMADLNDQVIFQA